MDIDTPLRELGEFDATALRDCILDQDELAWHEDEYRQQQFDVHNDTQSIVMVFTHGENWPNSEVRREPGWARIADVAIPLMEAIILSRYPPGGRQDIRSGDLLTSPPTWKSVQIRSLRSPRIPVS